MREQQKLRCLKQLSPSDFAAGKACTVEMRGAVRLVNFHALARTDHDDDPDRSLLIRQSDMMSSHSYMYAGGREETTKRMVETPQAS